jgi:hypothetical protein
MAKKVTTVREYPRQAPVRAKNPMGHATYLSKQAGESRKYDIFIGVDQTGAVNKNGLPRELPATVLFCKENKIEVVTNIFIPSFQTDQLESLIKTVIPEGVSSKELEAFVCVDAALGLPDSTGVSLRKILERIRDFEFEGKVYGSVTANEFFYGWTDGRRPKGRAIEKISGSNSVFDLHPFQRNIGCGTYRILKEVSRSRPNYLIWPFELGQGTGGRVYVMAEGYPSLYWKMLLGLRKRSLESIQELFPDLYFASVDSADSFLLALAGLLYHNQVFNVPLDHICRREGWILGVPYEAVETMSFDPWQSTLRAQEFLQRSS